MIGFNIVKSTRKAEEAVSDKTVLAGDGLLYKLKRGQIFRIVDLKGNQAADTMFFDSDNVSDHYSAVVTMVKQKNIYLSTGTVLRAESGKELLTIIADTCGKHDTIGGSCSAQSNTVRYAHEKLDMHNCRDTFMNELSKTDGEYEKRDLAPNINFFMNVPVTPEGGLEFADGLSAPGYYVEMRAECNVTVLISNCPQLNNPCNDYNPTPIRVLTWDK